MNWHPIQTAPLDTEIMVYNSTTGAYRTKAITIAGKTEWPLTHWGQPGRWYPSPTHWIHLNEIKPQALMNETCGDPAVVIR